MCLDQWSKQSRYTQYDNFKKAEAKAGARQGSHCRLRIPNKQGGQSVHVNAQYSQFQKACWCHQEDFNGCLKKYASMETIWKHGINKHNIALRAVAVTVQYHFEDSSGLYKV